MIKKILFLLCICLFPIAAHATVAPVLYFSDITSGPATGLGDGSGSGAIVTVWGVNLGNSQGASTISACGAAPSYVYDWENASPHAGAPSDMYSYHKMQVITFSLGSSATGSAGITVTVGGVASNTLPFTVRSGNIHFVKSTGSNSNNGSWSSPWLTPQYACNSLAAGDILYVGAMTVTGTAGSYILSIGQSANQVGTAANPYSVIAYPGAAVVFTVPADGTSSSYGIAGNYYNSEQYWTFSRITIMAQTRAICFIENALVVGCEITATSAMLVTEPIGVLYGGPPGAPGQGWAAQIGSGMQFIGDYVHDTGYVGMTKMNHTTYFSNRSTIEATQGFTLAWNYFYNNLHNEGINFYDENECGNWGSAHYIHDNVISMQYGVAIDLSTACFSGSISGVTIANGGSGYVVGNVIQVTQSGGSVGQLQVATVSSGAITSVNFFDSQSSHTVAYSGSGYSVANGLATTAITGTGSGATINITAITNPVVTSPFYVYNNLLINTGQSMAYSSQAATHETAISIGGSTNQGPIYLYNNTVYGWGNLSAATLEDSNHCNGGCTYGAIFISGTNTSTGAFGGSLYLQNNIFIDTIGLGYLWPTVTGSTTPSAHSNNLWYYMGGSESAPSWDTAPLTSNPLFTNVGSNDFSLQAGSPALGAGYNLTATYPYDILGDARPVPQSIGAFDATTIPGQSQSFTIGGGPLTIMPGSRGPLSVQLP